VSSYGQVLDGEDFAGGALTVWYAAYWRGESPNQSDFSALVATARCVESAVAWNGGKTPEDASPHDGYRTLGLGKCFDGEMAVLFSKSVDGVSISLTLFSLLSFGCVGDWREQFLSDVVLARDVDVGLAPFVHAALAVTFG
jgi:hypothetical protein